MDKDRDFVIERLEKQVIEKENEIVTLKTSIKKEIIKELLPELLSNNPKDDSLSIVKAQMEKCENKIKELSNIITGITNELLDQKSILNSFKNQNTKEEYNYNMPIVKGIKKEDQTNISDIVNHRYDILHGKNHDVIESNKIIEKPKACNYIIASDDSKRKDKKINKIVECEDVECREDEGVTIITRKQKDFTDI